MTGLSVNAMLRMLKSIKNNCAIRFWQHGEFGAKWETKQTADTFNHPCHSVTSNRANKVRRNRAFFSSLPFFALRVLVVGGERKKTGSSKSFCATDFSVAAAIDRGERRTLASGVGASVLSKRVASESAGFMTDGRDWGGFTKAVAGCAWSDFATPGDSLVTGSWIADVVGEAAGSCSAARKEQHFFLYTKNLKNFRSMLLTQLPSTSHIKWLRLTVTKFLRSTWHPEKGLK